MSSHRPMSCPQTSLALLTILALLGCSQSANEDNADSAKQTQEATSADEEKAEKDPILVRVTGLTVGTVEKRLDSTATVQSLDVVDVMPERTEPVIGILVEEGDHVEIGQILAQLRDDSAKLALAEAQVRVKETSHAMEQAKREFERDQSLVESGGPTGVLSDRDLEIRRQAWDASLTALASAEVARDRALLELAQCTLRSPITGTVSARDISLGDMTGMGTRVFEITDLSHPKVILYRPQRELVDLRVGQTLTATSDAFPGLEVHGQIERIAPTVDLATGTVKVTAALNVLDQRIPTGVLVKLSLVIDTHADVLLVPKQSLIHEGEHIYCYAIRDGHAVRVEVFQGFENDDAVEAAENTALTLTDQVVVVGADRIQEGDPVEIADE